MKKLYSSRCGGTLLAIACIIVSFLMTPNLLQAATGGPDAYGYYWEDSNEATGPTYNWIDITSLTGAVQITGLADDNIVGPYFMGGDMPYYWYSRKKIWVGSNGYISFDDPLIASPFPTIPTVGGGNDFIAALMSDLSFSGTGNPAQAWFYDSPDTAIISYLNVPFWSPNAPFYSGDNTFQIILSKVDSTIVVQYETQTGLSASVDYKIGIEDVTGSFGLQHSDSLPLTGYAIRYYPPVTALTAVDDVEASWNNRDGNLGMFAQRNQPFDLHSNYINTGNTPLNDIATSVQVTDLMFQVQVSDNWTIDSLPPGIDTTVTYPAQFTPTTNGIYSFQSTLAPVPNELVTANNQKTAEIVVIDTTTATQYLRWHGQTDDGIGLSWNGGMGGIGVYLPLPYSPCRILNTRFRINANPDMVSFYAKIYAPDGPNGTPGTLIDSVEVPATAGIGDLTISPSVQNLMVSDSGIYVLWDMGGTNISLARDNVGPFSHRTFEILGGNQWSEYRDLESEDFFIGATISDPSPDDICPATVTFPTNGSTISVATNISVWIKNHGVQPESAFDVSFQFGNEPPVTETYTGGAIAGGDSTLYLFSTQFWHDTTATEDLCIWTTSSTDQVPANDTTCITVTVDNPDTMTPPPPGFAEQLLAASVKIWPNPAREQIQFLIDPSQPAQLKLTIYDLNGRIVTELDLGSVSATKQFGVSLNGWAEGVYHYRLSDGIKKASGRFVKSH